MRLTIIFLVCIAMVRSFTPIATVEVDKRTTKSHRAMSSGSHEHEISRRVALVTAAALAATGSMSSAEAATLARQVQSIEGKNINEVNTKGSPEKHLPKINVVDTEVTVVVPHVMDPEKPHYIQYVWLKDIKSNKVTAVKSFESTDASPPTLTATVSRGSTVKPLLYCNLHGLWEGENITI